MTCFFALKLEIAFVNRTDIYRQAIERTFANLYGVHPTRWMLTGRPARPSLGCLAQIFVLAHENDPDPEMRSYRQPLDTLRPSAARHQRLGATILVHVDQERNSSGAAAERTPLKLL
jgi:hypothetical protein